MGKPFRKAQARLAARMAIYKAGQGYRAPGSENRKKSISHQPKRKTR